MVVLIIFILLLFLRRTPQEDVLLSETINPNLEMVSINRSADPESIISTDPKDHSDSNGDSDANSEFDSNFDPAFEEFGFQDGEDPRG
jgi:hypothetical protein